MIWFQKQRVGFILSRLAHRGRVIRADVAEKFEVSIPTASADFRLLEEHYPGAAVYDSTEKAYIPGPRFDEYRAEAAAFVVSGDTAPA